MSSVHSVLAAGEELGEDPVVAMTTCRECDKPLSDEAPACPHCGVQWPSQGSVKQENRRRFVRAVVVVGFLVVAAMLFAAYQSYNGANDEACETLQSIDRDQGRPERSC
jgi:hypothetical protein